MLSSSSSSSSSTTAAATGGAYLSANQQPARQCQSLSTTSDSQNSAPFDSPTSTTSATITTINHCHLSRYNTTNFSCTCDKFGFLQLSQQYYVSSTGLSPPASFGVQNEGQFQWGAQPYDASQSDTTQFDPRLYDPQSSYVVNKGQLANGGSGSTGIVSSIMIVTGVVALIVFIGGLIVCTVPRLSSQTKLTKKQQSFFDPLGNGVNGTTEPLTDHNLMGSDPLVSSAATTHSASIIGLSTSANVQLCGTRAPPSVNELNYKPHQLYAHHPPMIEAYSTGAGHAKERWPLKIFDWLIQRPASWLSGHLGYRGCNQVEGQLGGGKSSHIIQHRLMGGTNSGSTLLEGHHHTNTSSSGYHSHLHQHKNQYQNGYTTSLGLHQPIHAHGTRAQISSTGSQSVVPLNSSSNSSYVSSSAYYEEIGPGNLTKVNTSHTIVEPFKRQQHYDQHMQHQSLQHPHLFQQWQQQQQQQTNVANQSTISYSMEAQRNTAVQPMSLITKQHLHNDLSPLQSSSSSSAGSQHSAATNGNGGATTPRHYLFASSSAVSAYKQQQQQHQHQNQFKAGFHQHNQAHHDH